MQNHILHSKIFVVVVEHRSNKGPNHSATFSKQSWYTLRGQKKFLFAGWSSVFPSEEGTSAFQGQPELCHCLVTEPTRKLGLLYYSNKSNTFFNFNFHPAFRNVVSSFIKYSLCFTFSVVANMQSSTNANTWLDSPFSIKRFCNIAAQQLPLMASPKGRDWGWNEGWLNYDQYIFYIFQTTSFASMLD